MPSASIASSPMACRSRTELPCLDHGADQRPWRVVFAAVAPRIAHVADLGLVEVGKLMLLLLRAKAQPVHQLQCVPQRVAALELVFDLAEDLADFVLDRGGTG